ncbi:uncharacterized protein J7T54_003039 [Emericellopsis cladophorae]|uniref:Sulfatase N-terminal domain-containing protein n=1 Tax=Emericellopsis cladophorae TaxID=2686198 RepID=A0A9Q0BD75_9HYPO|nr:uncharacterized protein J7T54_003039 [Emericellopsis cladophorae]KAI6780260.1 hypothetical protein J7T54_003039 [Emericellopsis cladophorae]
MGSAIESPRRNILFLIADDLGKCLPCYGAKGLNTPNIDKLAATGTVFDNAFTSTASCSASRTVMYTGLHPHENGQYGLMGGVNHYQSFDHIQSGALLFNSLGYQTGIIGKVHVGPPSVFPWAVREESETRNVAWTAERAETFFQETQASEKPFFLTVGYVDPHRDITTRGGFGNQEDCKGTFTASNIQLDQVEIPDWLTDVEETRQEYVEYYKAIERLDHGIGLMLDALDRQGLTDSTLVVLCSDNGPPFINSKTTLYDAGVRLPFIVRQPGASAAGTRNPNMISYIDILPTFLDWAGAPSDLSAPVEAAPGQIHTMETRPPPHPKRLGRSFLSILGREEHLDALEWQQEVFGSHTFHEIHNYWPTRFLRTKRFKYHRNIAWQLDFPFASDLYASLSLEGIRKQSTAQTGGDVMVGARSLRQYIKRPVEELYDMEADSLEVNNVADKEEFRGVLEQMRARVEAWQFQTGDPWLLRDGQSVHALQRYAQEDLRVPGAWDFVVDGTAYRRMKMRRVDDPLQKHDEL